MDKVATAILAAIVVLGPMSYVAYTWDGAYSEPVDDDEDTVEEEIDHTKHLHPAPELEAALVNFEGEQFISGMMIHDHPIEVRVEVTTISAEGTDSDLIATDMDGSWTFDIEIENRSEDIYLTFRAHNLPEDTWSDNLTIIIDADVVDDSNNTDDGSGNQTTGSVDNNTDNNTSGNGNSTNNPPACTAGPDLTSKIDDMVYLNATDSVDPDGDNLSNPYWQILESPIGSTTEIDYASTIIAEITPDVIGLYSIEFYIDDGVDWCKDIMELNATEATIPPDNITGNGTGEGNQTTYDPADLSQFWLDFFMCQTAEDRPLVDDLDTSATDNHQCEVMITVTDTHVVITSNGLPNHDFESTLACTQGGNCGSAQNYTWNIPRSPVNDTIGGHDSTDCPEAGGAYECAPERGAIAVALNGVPFYGPEDGPGGDAVAAEHGAYNEDRQQIKLGVCHGHAAQGGTYHYHADANCMHWHPGEGEDITDYDKSTPQVVAPNTYDGNHSKVIGVAFDGYPIYGFWGYDENMTVTEMFSSYELKDGETGYNGIDDYKYTPGLGHLDECNGHYGPTPDFPDGIYHYHSTMQNGAGNMGFPYFLICYHGEADRSSDGGNGNGGDDPCAGYGETWGPGIGPPPEGCDPGPPPGDQANIEAISSWQIDPMIPIILLLCIGAAATLRRR